MTYSDASMVDDVQSNRPHTIDGAKVETKRATPREEGGSGKSVKKIFVGGFKDKLEDCDLETFFSAFGSITSAKQVLEKGSDKKLGFGFIEFDDYDAVDKIIISGSTHIINGVRVDVRKALDKNDMGGGFGSGGGGRRGDKGSWGSNQGFGGFGDGFGSQGGWGQQSGWNSQGNYGNQGGGGGGYGNGWQNSAASSNSWTEQNNSWGGPNPTNSYMAPGGSWGGGYGSGSNMSGGGGGAMRINNSLGNRSAPYPSGGRGGLRGGRGGGGAPAGQGRW